MKSKMDMLDEWIKNLIFPGDIKDFIKVIKKFSVVETTHKEFIFYTDENKYKIFVHDV